MSLMDQKSEPTIHWKWSNEKERRNENKNKKKWYLLVYNLEELEVGFFLSLISWLSIFYNVFKELNFHISIQYFILNFL